MAIVFVITVWKVSSVGVRGPDRADLSSESNIGSTLGALFGGLLLGVVLTTVSVMIFYWRSKKHVKKRGLESLPERYVKELKEEILKLYTL
uniref:Uncharacterized protein n=1 Tax=Magallana gigas TaxID=29159 RepID=K1R0A1_MAGGI